MLNPRRSILPAVLAAATVLAAQAAPALARETVAPRGNSGVEQYFEVVPGPRGDERPGAGDGKRGLSPQLERQLSAQGAAGRDLAQLLKAQSTAQAKRKGDRSSRSARGGDGSPPLATLDDAIGAGPQEGGMGLLLPLLLLASAAAIGGLALLRHRRA